jgi:hypothetical protein
VLEIFKVVHCNVYSLRLYLLVASSDIYLYIEKESDL